MLSNFDENEQPLLEKWGQKVTQKMFDRPGKLSIGSRKELLDIIEKVKSSEKEVLLLKPNAPKIISSLPYVLGLACAVGQVSKNQVDLTKPILVVGSTDRSMAKLHNMLSSSKVAGTPYLMKRGFISREDLKWDIYYRTFLVRNISDAKRVAFMDGQYDIILSNDNLCAYLSSHSFSIVVANGNKSLKEMSIRAKFEEHCQVLVLRYNRSQVPVIPTRPKSARFTTPHLVTWSKIITEERVRPFLSPLQFEALEQVRERISSGSSRRFPIEINTSSSKGIKTILATFPYLLGNAVLKNKECMDLHKPILMIAMENKCWSILRTAIGCEKTRSELLTDGLMTEEEVASGCHYKSHTIEDEFGLYTYDNDIFRQEVVLTHHQLLCNSDNKIKEECKKWNCNYFSAVLIFQNTHMDVEQEKELMHQFCGISTTFLRISRHNSLEIEVPTVISTIQHFGAETISPKLLGHCKNIKGDYLLGCNSILNCVQQSDLVSLFNWMMTSTSQSQTVLFKTNIGYDKASIVLLCLPFLIDWAKDNHLVPPGRSESDKPLLVLCNDGSSLKELCTNSTFHQQTLFSAEKCRHCKFRSYLVADVASAINIKQYRNSKMIVSEVKYLNYIPDNCCSSVIAFSKGQLDRAMIQSMKHKFCVTSKLAIIEAYSSADLLCPAASATYSSDNFSSCVLGEAEDRHSPCNNSRYTSTPERDRIVMEDLAERRPELTKVNAFIEEDRNERQIHLYSSQFPTITNVTELSVEEVGKQANQNITYGIKSKGNARRKSFLQSGHFWKHENRKVANPSSLISEDIYENIPEDNQTSSSDCKNESSRGNDCYRIPANTTIECFYMVPSEDHVTSRKATIGCLDVVSTDEKENSNYTQDKRVEIGTPKIIHVKPKLDYQEESF